MAKIIFEDTGPNFQVKGLPYEETFSYVHPIVFDTVPTTQEIEAELKKTTSDTLTNPWSIEVLKGFQDYIPTTFKRVTTGMSEENLGKYFGTEQNWIPEQERLLLQLQTEIEAKAATIDAAIIHQRRELGTVVNKAHLLNRIYKIGRIYGHLSGRDYPFLFGDLKDKSQWDSALSQMKTQFIAYMQEVNLGKRIYPKKVRKVDVSTTEIQNRFVYVEWLKQKLGDDLLGILLYGSAARTDNPSEYSDFDNWIRVKDIQRAHKILRGTCPIVYDGKVIEGYSQEIPGGKHLGIHLFPESEDYLMRHIRFLHDSREFLKHTRILYGEFPFQKVRQDEVIERGISQAYMKLKTIAGSLNWAYSTPEKLVGKPSLFEFIVKNVRFFLQHSLNAIESPRFRDKTELNQLLADRGLHIPEYKADPEHIRQSLLYAMVSVLTLQKEFINSGRKPNLEFLVDKKEYTNWSDPKIDDWGQYDDD